MTHYHYLIICGFVELGKPHILDDTATVYTVGIGSSLQANRDYLFLTAFAADYDCYFAPRSTDSMNFVYRVLAEYHIPQAQQLRVDARSLVRAIKAGLKSNGTVTNLSAAHRLRQVYDLNYRISCRLAERKSICKATNAEKPNAL